MTRQWTRRVQVVVAAVAVVLGLTVSASQREDVAGLRDRLREGYDVLALQDGIALVPRQRDARVRIIEIRAGAVAVDGEEVTGRQLRERLGADAEPILRASYLDREDQSRLVTAEDRDPAPVQPDAPGSAQRDAAAPADARRARTLRHGDLVRVFGNVNISRDERVEGDVVVVFGNAYIDGEVDGELTVVMGNAYMGPESLVDRDVHVIGGNLNRSPGSRVEGSVNNVGVGGGDWPRWSFPGLFVDTMVGRLGSMAATLFRVGLLALLALIVVAFGHNTIERIAERTAADPLRAGLVGFFAQLLFFPLLVIAVIVLAISIIGIPLLLLLPFVFLLALIALVVGFTGVAYQVGRVLNRRFGWDHRSTYATVIVGVLVIAAVTLVARAAAIVGGSFLTFPLSAVGYLVEYTAWTLGLGAAILAWIRSRDLPPPLPV